MKKSLILAPLAVATLCFASNEAEEFFYQRGLDAGYQQGYEKGVEDALEEAKKILARYKDEIKAYEIGKYLVEKSYITYPKVWQRLDEFGNLKIEIQPSKIEKPLNLSEIFGKFGVLPTNPNPEKISKDPINSRNSVYSAVRDTTTSLPSKVDSNRQILTISLEKSSKHEEILKKANLVYSVDKDRLKVLFFNRTEKENFCNQFKICE